MENLPVMLITGAANGIGLRFANAAAGKFRLILVDLDGESLEAAFAGKEQVIWREMDVSDAPSWEILMDWIRQEYGRLDYLLNVAGVIHPRFILEADSSHVDVHLDVNARGVIYGTTFGAQLMEGSGGHIINFASLAGVAPIAGISFYSASKFAVRGFSLAAAMELKDKGIDVTVICPDLIKTAMYHVQVRLPEESALTFSGPRKVLTVEDMERVIWKAIRRRPLEVTMPAGRGWLAKLGSAFPALGMQLYRSLRRKGLKRLASMEKTP